jgi:hypothetical protein
MWHSTGRFYKNKDITECCSSRKSRHLGYPTLENGTSGIHGGPMIWLPRFLTLHPVISFSGGRKEMWAVFGRTATSTTVHNTYQNCVCVVLPEVGQVMPETCRGFKPE